MKYETANDGRIPSANPSAMQTRQKNPLIPLDLHYTALQNEDTEQQIDQIRKRDRRRKTMNKTPLHRIAMQHCSDEDQGHAGE